MDATLAVVLMLLAFILGHYLGKREAEQAPTRDDEYLDLG